MPYALVLHCFPQNETLNPEDLQGQKALALFLQELIQKQDAKLATRLHAPRNSKPFTTAILLPAEKGNLQSPRLSKETRRRRKNTDYQGEIKIRITLLDDALYPLLSRFFLHHITGPSLLHLGQSSLLISRVTVTPQSEEMWAGFASFQEMLDQALETETSWVVHFFTPTTFKMGDAEIPLPFPRLCFQSWLNSWEEHSPYPFFTDKETRKTFLTQVVEGNVSVAYTRLNQSKQAYYFDGRNTWEQGFVGICRFSVKPAKVAPHYRKILATLARYSFFSGTGRKTTMGMGVTKFVSPGKEGSK